MYLTKIRLDGDDYKMHQAIRGIFPGSQRVLFQRSDMGVLVFSAERSVKDGLEVKEIDLSSLAVVGEQHIFTLRLNPAKRDIKTKKRVALSEQETRTWIEEKLKGAGVDSKFKYAREGSRRSMKGEIKISLASVLCYGVLTVKDPDLFRRAVEQGIGHGKGLGFGFLNIF